MNALRVAFADRWLSFVQRLPFVFCIIPLMGCEHAPVTLSVFEGKQHQTIAGWEVTARAWEFDKVADRFDGSVSARKDQLARLLADEVGIDRLRLEIKSGMENPIDYWTLFASGKLSYSDYRRHFYDKINDNDDPHTLDPSKVHFSDLDWHVENFVLPLKSAVEARNRRFRLNLAYIDFNWTDIKGTLSHAKNPAEYAELVTAAFVHLQAKYGLRPDSLELIVEPDNTDDWSGTAIGRAIVAVSDRLKGSGFSGVEIIAPSTAKGQNALAYYGDIQKVPGASERLATLSYHRYNGEPDASDLTELARVAATAGKRTAMLEYVDADITDLLADLTDGSATAWQQYGIGARVDDNRPLRPGWLLLDRAGPPASLTLSPIARQLALVFRNVESGSIRVGTSVNSDDVAAAAFVTPQQKLVVVMHAGATLALSLVGVRPGSYRLSGVDADGRMLVSTSMNIQERDSLPVVRDATYVLIEN